MLIKIDNRDLAYTIDSYGMFEINDDEYILESVNEPDIKKQYGYGEDEEIRYDNINWTYRHKDYVEFLAKNSIGFIEDNLKGDIVKSITYIKSNSPRFNNFTTDWYVAEWDIDEKSLRYWMDNNVEPDDWINFKHENWNRSELDKDSEWYNPEYEIVAMLDYWSQEQYDPEEYESSMFEIAGGYEFIDYEVKKNDK